MRLRNARLNEVGYYLGIGIANLTSTLDLPMVVVGGGLANAWDLFAPALFQSVRRFSVVYRLAEPSQRLELEHERTYIRPAALGSSAGLLGAGLLPLLVPAARESAHTLAAAHNLVSSAPLAPTASRRRDGSSVYAFQMSARIVRDGAT